MKKFHINGYGDPGECHATVGKCPFGGDESHYPSASEAREAFEHDMRNYVIPETIKDQAKIDNVLSGNLIISNKEKARLLEKNPKLAHSVEIINEIEKMHEASRTLNNESVYRQHDSWIKYIYRKENNDGFSFTVNEDGSATVNIRIDKETLNRHPIENYSFNDFNAEASYVHFITSESKLTIVSVHDDEVQVMNWEAKILPENVESAGPNSNYFAGAYAFMYSPSDEF